MTTFTASESEARNRPPNSRCKPEELPFRRSRIRLCRPLEQKTPGIFVKSAGVLLEETQLKTKGRPAIRTRYRIFPSSLNPQPMSARCMRSPSFTRAIRSDRGSKQRRSCIETSPDSTTRILSACYRSLPAVVVAGFCEDDRIKFRGWQAAGGRRSRTQLA